MSIPLLSERGCSCKTSNIRLLSLKCTRGPKHKIKFNCSLFICNIHNSGNIAFNYSVFTHKFEIARAACDLNTIVIGEGLLKVTGSHAHWKRDNISETMLDSDAVTTGH